ncbi:MAG: hydroxymethylglutaryl-CoA lyase [Bacteroidota bacterium]|nr:hydroxymethylglutaryl-CoA lyase [Bacteroidota bacterium]
MQGIKMFIPTVEKISYLNKLLLCNFDILDFGSFVSAKAIPQLVDTAAVYMGIEANITQTQLLCIVANIRGAEYAIQYPAISYVGFPLSISETFQQRNTNKSIAASEIELAIMNETVQNSGKQMVVYLSMGFGNPYGDEYGLDILSEFTEKMFKMGIKFIRLSDTLGSADNELITNAFNEIISNYQNISIGAHLHATALDANSKIKSALLAGCNTLDGAILGYGGCPLADDHLTGNIDTLNILQCAEDMGIEHSVNISAIEEAKHQANYIFSKYL